MERLEETDWLAPGQIAGWKSFITEMKGFPGKGEMASVNEMCFPLSLEHRMLLQATEGQSVWTLARWT